MLKFIDKIIDKIHNWIQKQERDYTEYLIESLCKEIIKKYKDLTIKCYYKPESPNEFLLHINERYVENNAFNNYMEVNKTNLKEWFPKINLIWGHFDVSENLYYDKKKDVLIFQ